MHKRQETPVQLWEEDKSQSRIDGVLLGVVARADDSGRAYVDYPSNPSSAPLPAQSTVQISQGDVGREVALVFLQGHPMKPVVMGFLQHPQPKEVQLLEQILSKDNHSLDVNVDSETLTLSANREIILRCGEASITLTRAGKILLKGKYLLSRSSGVNRIKGGSVQIN